MASKRIKDALLSRALTAKRESKHIEFKESFDSGSYGQWCEVIKDVIALANSGGGAIVFGLDSHGRPSKLDATSIAKIDPAQVVDKVAKFVDVQLSEMEVLVEKKNSFPIVIWRVPPADVPIVFVNPGVYETEPKKHKTAFGRGTLYFRHGAKSEPARQQDLRESFERRLERVRKDWARGMRKVVEAPENFSVHVLPPDVTISDKPSAKLIRITTDPSAPAFFKLDPNTSFPYRQKELVAEINSRLPKGIGINQHDVLSVRRCYSIDANETFTYHPKFGSPQYSSALVAWIVQQHAADANFFLAAREKYYEKTHSAD